MSVFIHQNQLNPSKFDLKALKCVFVGYFPTQQGYKCYNPTTCKFIISCDVSFLKNQLFFHNTTQNKNPVHNWSTVISVPLNPLASLPPTVAHQPTYSSTSISPFLYHQGEEKEETEIQQGDQDLTKPLKIYSRRPKIAALQPTNLFNLEVSPDKTIDTDINIQQQLADDLSVPIALRNGRRMCTKHPINDFIEYSNLSPSFKAFTISLDSVAIPRNVYQALQDENWKMAIIEEMAALEKNGTWEIMDLPEGKKAVGSKWVFTLKYKSDGSLERYKVRLVAQGFTQIQGLDYEEMYAPVAKLNSIWILLSLAVNLDWKLHQLDIKNTFLNRFRGGDLH